MARKLRQLPQHIHAVPARNAKNRFFIPSKTIHFAGMRCDCVMIDNGCNSFLLPFNEECMTRFSGEMYQFSEFDDLEDEDHDGDADEEYLQYEDIDEPVDEYME